MKKILIYSAFFAGGIATAFLILLIYGLSFTQNVIIQNITKQYYHASRIVLFGGVAVGFISDSSPDNKKLETMDHSFKIVSTGTIATIFLNPFESVYVPPQYLGVYHINASGHEGILALHVKDGVLYGSVRFPNWANGVWEPLKKVTIKNNSLAFTRSVTTEQERIKTGAREYFTQYYVGTYKENGKKIIGFYKSRGAKYLFEAHKKK
ncbi:MAG: hypothetical protein ACUVRK_10445 [Spirochaetota bacterium]